MPLSIPVEFTHGGFVLFSLAMILSNPARSSCKIKMIMISLGCMPYVCPLQYKSLCAAFFYLYVIFCN